MSKNPSHSVVKQGHNVQPNYQVFKQRIPSPEWMCSNLNHSSSASWNIVGLLDSGENPNHDYLINVFPLNPSINILIMIIQTIILSSKHDAFIQAFSPKNISYSELHKSLV